jgi:hypothetical protein
VRRIVCSTAVFLLSGAALAGCSGTEAGQPSPVTAASGSVEPSESLSFPAELDVTPYMARPCDVLSSEVLESRGYSAAGEELGETGEIGQGLVDLTGPTCSWRADNTTHAQVVSVALIEPASEGVDAIWGRVRERHRSGVMQLWEEVDVGGYPAAYYGVRDNRGRGDCSMMIAVSASALVTLHAGPYMDNPEQACSDANDFVADLLGNLEGGA